MAKRAFSPYIRVAEDVVLVAGVAVTAWQTTHSAADVVAAVSGAPLVRSFLATQLTGGRTSGILEAITLIRAALGTTTDKVDVPVVPVSDGSVPA